MKDKILYFTSVTIIVIAVMILSYFFYLYFLQDNPPIKYNSVIVHKEENNIIIDFDICKFTIAKATVYISYVNDRMYDLASYETVGMPKGCSKVSKSYIIPEDLPKGEYYLYGKVIYKVNKLADRTVEWKTNKFIIE